MKQAHLFNTQRTLPHHALLQFTVTVEREIAFPYKGEIRNAIFEKDYLPGLYAFTSIEKRDRFVSMINSSHDEKPCAAVSLQPL